MTMAQKAVALTAPAVVDLAVFAIGGSLLAFGALLATLPVPVTVAARSAQPPCGRRCSQSPALTVSRLSAVSTTSAPGSRTSTA